MEFEDSRNALFPEPNACIQRFEKREKATKKIVFQEPYECLPNHYINNNFTKHDCDCVSKSRKEFDNKHKQKGYHDFNCNRENFNSINQYYRDGNCHNDNNSKQSLFGIDIKSLLPLLSMFNKGGGADFSGLVGLLNNTNNSQNVNNSNPMNMISSILSNKDVMSGILNMFKGGGLNLFGKKQTAKKELKTTDFEIKNYTRVE